MGIAQPITEISIDSKTNNFIQKDRSSIVSSILRVVSLVLLMLWGITAWVPVVLASSPEKDKVTIGTSAPLFTAKDLHGKVLSLQEVLKNHKAVVVNFWGIRCAACIMEMPYLDQIFRKYETKGVFIFGVNVDGMAGDVIRTKMKQLNLAPSYCIVEDPEFLLVDIYKMSAAPLTFVIDSGGIIRYRHEGFDEGEEQEIEKAVEIAINASVVSPK